MSWLGSTGLADFALSALTEAQKRIDKVLDIREDHKDGPQTKSNLGKTSQVVKKVVKHSTDGEKEKSLQISKAVAKSTSQTSPVKKQSPVKKPTVTAGNESEFSWNALFDGESKNPTMKSPGKSPSKKSKDSTTRRSSFKKEETSTAPQAVSLNNQHLQNDNNEKQDKEKGKLLTVGQSSDKALINEKDRKEKLDLAVAERTETDMPNMPDMPVVCEELNSISAVVDSSDFVDGQSCDNSNKQKDSQAKEIMETIPLSQNGDLVSSELKETTCSPTQAKIHEPVLHLEVNDCLPPEDASQNLKSSTDSQDKVDIPSKLALLPPSSLDDLSECDQTVTTSQQTCSNVMDAKPLEDATVVTQRNMESPEKEIAQLSELVQARETQLLTATQENTVLRATIDSLKTQLEKMEETQAANNSDVDNVRKEFSDRISAKEKKLQAVSRDRDQLKRRLQDLEKEQQNRYATVRVL
jgi:hypothetical protein